MNGCPPQPGLTVMHSAMSIAPATSASAPTGVAGLIATPTPAPALANQIRGIGDVRGGLGVKGDRVARPPARSRTTCRSGRSIIRCTSSIAAGRVRLLAQRTHDQRPDRDRRHEVAVHHIHMDHPRAGVQHLPDLLAQSARSRRTGSTAPRARPSAAHLADALISACSIESPQLLHLTSRRRGHAHDRRVLAAVGTHRGELEAVQAVHAAVAPRQVRRAQPRLAAVRAQRPELRPGLWRAPAGSRATASALPAQPGDEEAGGAVAMGQRQHSLGGAR